MESSIRELIAKAAKEAYSEAYGLEDISFAVEQPKDLTHGDYSTNVALILAKLTKVGPSEVAEKLVEVMKSSKVQPSEIADISVAGIGFINFTLSKEFFSTKVSEVISKSDQWGKSSVHAGKHILVEHSSPNLFKPFHIGHVMNNAIGESIDRLANFSGAEVKTISFPSDISLGVAKAIFIILEKHVHEGHIFEPSMIILGDAYVEGTKRYEDDESIHTRVKEIADNLYNQTPSAELDVFNTAKKFNIDYFEHITEKLGSHFDDYIYESEAGVKGKEIVLQNTPAVFTESEGAIVYVPEEGRKDINTAVFINSQGNPTYEAKDIGLLSMKFSGEPLDFSIFITDNQQVPHFQVVLAAAHKIQSEWSEKSIHVHHGRMSFKGQKMSSRLGGVPLAETLIDTVAEEVKEKALRDAQGLRPIDIDAIAIAALKFSILRAAAGKDINFDPETSLSFEGDSGPYLQYSTVRANSILTKSSFSLNTEYLTIKEWQTTEVEKLLIHFPEVVERAIQEWSPHFIVTYLLELAQAFNSWYGNTKIIDDSAESPYKLALTKAFAQTMTNGLTLLGISVPEKM